MWFGKEKNQGTQGLWETPDQCVLCLEFCCVKSGCNHRDRLMWFDHTCGGLRFIPANENLRLVFAFTLLVRRATNTSTGFAILTIRLVDVPDHSVHKASDL